MVFKNITQRASTKEEEATHEKKLPMTKLYAEIIKKCRWKFVCKETVKKQVNHAKIANERDRQTDRNKETE